MMGFDALRKNVTADWLKQSSIAAAMVINT
jgi:hypothetical protein